MGDNMIQCGKEVAEPLMDTQVMDVLQALIMKAKLDLGNATVNETLQKIKKICEHALNLAHSMGVIKTYVKQSRRMRRMRRLNLGDTIQSQPLLSNLLHCAMLCFVFAVYFYINLRGIKYYLNVT